MIGRRRFFATGGACVLCGCSGAVHRLPQLSGDNLALAQDEVRAAAGQPPRRAVSDSEATDALRSALNRIRTPADRLCREMGVGVCEWTFRASADRSLNAGAGPNGLILMNYGIVDYAANEEQIALVIAHEIGHQAANHVATSQRNQAMGAIIGALILGAAGAYAARGSYYPANTTRTAMEAGANLGGAVGRISFSKEQEREADYLAALILYRAGVNLDAARGFLVTMARLSGRANTGMLDTHPAGPERIAGWDQAVTEIRATRGMLPQRAA
jgi:predicted Zn-dependent protease